MTLRPKLKPAVSQKDFRANIAEMAAELARHIELNVESFAPDPAAKAERLRRVAELEGGYQYFMETYLPHYVRGEHSLFHQHIFKRVPEILASQKGVRGLFVAPRGASKSTHLSLGFALYCIVRGLKHYIIEICDVYEQAALLIEALKAELTTNVRLQNDFPEACGQGRLWREGEFISRNNVKVQGLGAGKKARGRRHGPFRPDLVVLDDIENDEDVLNPKLRQKLWNWIYRAVLKLGPPAGGMDVLWVNTVLHFDAVTVRASRHPTWKVVKFQAVVKFPDRMDLWDRFEEIYHNAADGNGETEATAFYEAHKAEMDQGAVVNWPSVQPLLFLMLERAADLSAFLSSTLRGTLLSWIIDYNLPGAAVPWVWRIRAKNEKAEAETRKSKAGAAEATNKAIQAIVKAAAAFEDDEIARDYIVSFEITDQLSDSTSWGGIIGRFTDKTPVDEGALARQPGIRPHHDRRGRDPHRHHPRREPDPDRGADHRSRAGRPGHHHQRPYRQPGCGQADGRLGDLGQRHRRWPRAGGAWRRHAPRHHGRRLEPVLRPGHDDMDGLGRCRHFGVRPRHGRHGGWGGLSGEPEQRSLRSA